MKTRYAKHLAEVIGDNSFSLINFDQLPDSASSNAQIEALRKDQRWQEEQNNETSKKIDYLCSDIEDGL